MEMAKSKVAEILAAYPAQDAYTKAKAALRGLRDKEYFEILEELAKDHDYVLAVRATAVKECLKRDQKKLESMVAPLDHTCTQLARKRACQSQSTSGSDINEQAAGIPAAENNERVQNIQSREALRVSPLETKLLLEFNNFQQHMISILDERYATYTLELNNFQQRMISILDERLCGSMTRMSMIPPKDYALFSSHIPAGYQQSTAFAETGYSRCMPLIEQKMVKEQLQDEFAVATIPLATVACRFLCRNAHGLRACASRQCCTRDGI